jgi:hypothetical protein
MAVVAILASPLLCPLHKRTGAWLPHLHVLGGTLQWRRTNGLTPLPPGPVAPALRATIQRAADASAWRARGPPLNRHTVPPSHPTLRSASY